MWVGGGALLSRGREDIMQCMSNDIRNVIRCYGWDYSLTYDGWVNVRSHRGEVNFLRVNNVTYKVGRTKFRYLNGPDLIDMLEEYL